MDRTKLLIVSALLVVGCGGGAATDTQNAQGSETSGDEASATHQDTCVAFFTRQRECGEAFLPELVALRVRLDRPAGTAAREQSDHESLMADARAEFAADTTDEAIAGQCQGIMGSPDAAQAAEGFQACLQSTDCGSFVQCDVALLEQHWASEDAAASTTAE